MHNKPYRPSNDLDAQLVVSDGIIVRETNVPLTAKRHGAFVCLVKAQKDGMGRLKLALCVGPGAW